MQIAKELAGFSGAKADDLRKAIGKKNRAAMAALEAGVRRGLPRLGHEQRGDRVPVADQREVGRLLVQQEPRRLLRADRLPHGVAEGQLPRRVHGRADLLGDVDEGQGAVLRRPLRGDGDRDPAARREPLRPRVHGRRRAGRIGTSASASTPSRASATRRSRRSSARARRAGEFASLWDFCERVDSRTVNKKAIEALIKCGALGSTGASRKGMLTVLEQAQARRPEGPAGRADRPGLDLRPRRSRRRPTAPTRRRGAAGARASARPLHPPIPAEEFDQAELLAAEKEAIGLFVSAHPLKPMREALRARVDCPLAALAERRDKDWVTVGGIITEAKRIRTRNGDPMMFATLDDLAGSVEMLVFGKALAEHEAALAVDQVVLVQGPRRPQGSRQDVPGRAERRALRAERRRRSSARAQADAAPRARNAPGARARRCTCASHATALCASADRGAARRRSRTSRARPRCVLDIDTSAGTRRLRLGKEYRVAAHADAARRARTRARALPRSPSTPAEAAARSASPAHAPGRRAAHARARAGASPARLPRAAGLRASRRASPARRAASAGPAPTGTRRSRARRARRRRRWRGGRGWSRAASASR